MLSPGLGSAAHQVSCRAVAKGEHTVLAHSQSDLIQVKAKILLLNKVGRDASDSKQQTGV